MILYNLRTCIVVVITFHWRSLAMQTSDYVRLISEVRGHFVASSVFLLYDSLDGVGEADDLRKSIRLLSVEGVCSMSTDFERLFDSVEFHMQRIRRPLFVVFLNSNERVAAFSKFTRNYTMAYPIWLLIFDGDVGAVGSTSLRSENTPRLTFDTEMLVFRTNSRNIEEWYLIRDKLRTNDFATWDPDTGFVVRSSKILYERRNDLENSTLVMTLFYKDTMDTNSLYVMSALFTNIVVELGRYLNFNIKTIVPTKHKNRLNTVIGMLVTREADITPSALTFTTSRMALMDFTHPLLVTTGKLYIRQPEGGIRWSGYLTIFSPTIWHVIGILILLATILLKVAVAVKGNGTRQSSFIEQFLLVLGVYCQQGLPEFPAPLSLRIAYFSVFVSALVVSASYSASLISYLANTSPILPFSSLESFLEEGTYKLIVLQSSADYNRFTNSTNPTLVKVSSMIKPVSELPRSSTEAVYQICKERVAFYFESPISEVVKKYSPCRIVGIDTKLLGNFGIITSKNNPYHAVLNYYIKRFRYTGIYDRFYRLYFRQTNPPKAAFYQVTVKAVTPILMCIAVGLIFSVVLLFFERIFVENRYSVTESNKILTLIGKRKSKRCR